MISKFCKVFLGFFVIFIITNEIGLRFLWESITLESPIKTNVMLHDGKRYFCTEPKLRTKVNEYLGWTEYPNSIYYEFRNRGVNKFTHDELGFRNKILKNHSDNSIIFLGESHLRGTLADDEDNITGVLNRLTNEYKFLNFGTGGYGSINQYLLYKQIKKKINHDVVIILFYLPDDIRKNMYGYNYNKYYHYRPFKIVNDEIILLKKNTRKSIAKSKKNGESLVEKKTFYENIKSFLRKNSKLYVFYSSKINTIISSNKLNEKEKFDIELGLKVTEKILLNIVKEVRQNNKKLIIFSIPGRQHVDKKFNLEEDYSVQSLDLLQRFSQENNIDFVDTSESISQIYKQNKFIYGWPDHHLNEKGYFEYANLIFDYLKRKKILNKRKKDIEFNFESYDPYKVSC